MSNAKRVSITKTAITLDSIAALEFQKKGTVTAQLRQVYTTISYYDSKKVDNEFNGGLFSAEEFGFHEQDFTSKEERIAWILIPDTMEHSVVEAQLAKANAAGGIIYKVMSNAPILSEDQKYSIAKGLKTKDDYANSQVVRYGEGHPQAGQLILHNGRVQYRKTFFWPTHKDDVDMRGTVEQYLTPEMMDELAEAHSTAADAFAGQEVA